MSFFVYIIQNPEGILYIGHTSNISLRMERHNQGKARWTRSRGPWSLVYSERFLSRSEAMAKESGLKALKSKEALHRLIAQWQSPDLSGLTGGS
ncbi:MAG: GIY-YIG nuclease family protein [Chloroflexi bacterium]|nr:GIY-YIG nuclease family protein [Chloroflexota bacterium]